jgi:predicted DNA-binding protein YlxM (UPF0122 family)
MGKVYGIVTGDVVNSRSIDPDARKKLYADFDAFLKTSKKEWLKNFEVYRGDSFQCEVRKPYNSLRVALMIRAFFKAYLTAAEKKQRGKRGASLKGYLNARFDIRLSVGIGQVDFINKDKVSTSDGEAFQLSGEGLDLLKSQGQKLGLKTFDSAFNEQITPVVLLLDALIEKWTQNQAEIILYKLEDWKDEEIAEKLNISPSAITQRKKTAQWNAIEKTVTYFEKTMQNLIK